MQQNKSQGETSQDRRRFFRPLFDIFGVHPNFYLNGRDKTVSWIGCICSLVLFACIAVVGIIEIVSFVQKKNFELYTSEESLPEKPVIDVSTKGFLVVLRSIYPEGKPYSGLQDKFFTLNSTAITYKRDSHVPAGTPDLNPIDMKPCEELEMDVSDANYSAEDLKGAFCIEFKSGSLLGGGIESGQMNYLGFGLLPCTIRQPGDCEVLYEGVLTNTRDTTGPISEYFQDFVLEISYLQDYFVPNNFTHPLKKNLISQIQQRFDSQRTTWIVSMFEQIEVQTKSGFLFSDSKVESGLIFRSSDYNITPRDPVFEIQNYYQGAIGPLERLTYGNVANYLTNNIRKIERQYPSILDAFQNIGGSAEVLLFIFVFFMVMHHNIIMDL